MRGRPFKGVGERTAGEGIGGQRYGHLSEARGQLAIVEGGVKAQRFDLAQESDLLLEPASRPVQLVDLGQKIREQSIFFDLRPVDACRGTELPEGQREPLFALIALDLIVVLIVKQDDLQGW